LSQPIHATVVAGCTRHGWRGVLIGGPSGAGKSDLALRLIGRGWRLVADDYAHVWASGGALYARAPAAICGRIEARGLGILEIPPLGLAPLALAVDCTSGPVERLPEPAARALEGLTLPLLPLDPRHASAPDLVTQALARL
jgi:serine kinase of HPr protein (carbohydrate metabolism regulator)